MQSAKRPFFKGKGALSPWLPTVANDRDAELTIEVLEAEQQQLFDALRQLEQRAAVHGSRLPARLVRKRGGGLIWRKRSGSPAQETLFELLGTTGLTFLAKLAPLDQRWYLDIEAERLRLDLHWTLICRASVNLQRYRDRYRALRYYRKSLPTE